MPYTLLDNARGFGEQVAGKDQHNGTDYTQHPPRPLSLALACLVELGKPEIGDPQETEYRNRQSQNQATVFDVAFDERDQSPAAGAVLGATGVGNAAPNRLSCRHANRPIAAATFLTDFTTIVYPPR